MKKPITWISLILIFLVTAGTIVLRPLWKPLIFEGADPQSETYRVPHAYALTYPKGWRRIGSGEKTGYEILSIYSYNYRQVTDPGSGFSGDQIKIALSILDRNSSTLAEIVNAEFTGAEKNFTRKTLTINGRRAIQVTALHESDESFPVIETFIEYKDQQYAHLIGYYNGAEPAAQAIIKIQNSFQVLD